MAAAPSTPPDLTLLGAMGIRLDIRARADVAERDGWVPAREACAPARVDAMVAAIGEGAGGGPFDAHATFLVESRAWTLASAGALSALAAAGAPDLAGMSFDLRVSDAGYAEALTLPRDPPFHGDLAEMAAVLRGGLEANLAPLVGHLAGDRGARTPAHLWRAAGDRVAQATLWAGLAADRWDDGIRFAAELVAPPARFAVPVRALGPEGPLRLRAGCCLAYRVPGMERCEDCPAGRLRRLAARRHRSS